MGLSELNRPLEGEPLPDAEVAVAAAAMAAASLLVGVPRRGGLPVRVVKAAERMPEPEPEGERRLGEREDTDDPLARELGVLADERRSLTVSARALGAVRLLPR